MASKLSIVTSLVAKWQGGKMASKWPPKINAIRYPDRNQDYHITVTSISVTLLVSGDDGCVERSYLPPHLRNLKRVVEGNHTAGLPPTTTS